VELVRDTGIELAAHCYLCTRGVLVACDDERRYALVVRGLPFGQVYDALCCRRTLVQQRIYVRSARRPALFLADHAANRQQQP
jgi:hypothetical protein